MLNLNLKITNKLKLFIIITVSVLFVGLLIFGICGFNQSVDFRKSYEVDISVSADEQLAEKAKETANEYFEKIDVSDIGYAFSMQEDEGNNISLKYKFKNNIFDKIETGTLKNKIAAAFTNMGIATEGKEIEILLNEAKETSFNKPGWVTLALAVSFVAIFVYLFFMEKLASALSVIASGVLSALLFIAVMSIWRIPASPFVASMEILAVLLTVVLSTGLVTRFKEEMKNEGNSKLTNKELADKVANASILRFTVILAFIILASLLMIIIGTAYIKFLGLQFFVAGIVATFSAICWTPNLWLLLKNFKWKKSPKKKTIE